MTRAYWAVLDWLTAAEDGEPCQLIALGFAAGTSVAAWTWLLWALFSAAGGQY